jgi:flagellar hook-basal body complex protein FliE
MPTPVNAASLAMSAVQRAGAGPGAAAGSGARHADQTGGFADMVKSALTDTIAAGKQTEALSAAAVAGKGDLGQVVTAVAEAEVALQGIVAIRDRVVEAYKDIMRMPI